MSATGQIFIDIKNRLETTPFPIALPPRTVLSKTGKFVYMWNNTVKRLKAGSYAGIQPPFVFIEFKRSDVEQYSNSDQVLSMTIIVHIVHKFINSTDGKVLFDQDLDILDFKDWVYQMLNLFVPTNCGQMLRVEEEMDNDHEIMVDYKQYYKVKFTDSLQDQPIGGSVIPNAPPPVINPTMTITSD